MIARPGERRGEVPFIAIRVGQSNDPKEVSGLARDLKISRPTALGFLVLWYEFILEVGDALTGRVQGYTADHVAEKLGWSGDPKKLLKALNNAGLLNIQRKTFFHPYWLTSITGDYARKRAERREYEREKKRRQRDGDVPGMSPGQEGDVPGDSLGNPDIKKERKNGDGASRPPAPPASGGGVGAARWDWMQNNHKRPNNSRRCVPLLARMDAETWALCQWVVVESRQGGALSSSQKKRALRADSYRFLASESYLEFLPERRKKLAAENAPKPATSVEAAKEKAALSMAYVLEKLADPDLSEEKKEQTRALWRARNPGVAPPWEASSARAGAHADA